MSRTATKLFFGDADYVFDLKAAQIAELEQKTGVGIGLLCHRIFARQFALNELSEVIRLALIGGNTPPARAAQLVATYVADRPIAETYPIAEAILEARYFGNPHEEDQA